MGQAADWGSFEAFCGAIAAAEEFGMDRVVARSDTRAFLTALKDPVATVQTAAVRGLHELKDQAHNEPLIASFVEGTPLLQSGLS